MCRQICYYSVLFFAHVFQDSSSQAALDATLANLSTRVQEVKISLTKFVKKLEEEPMAW